VRFHLAFRRRQVAGPDDWACDRAGIATAARATGDVHALIHFSNDVSD
jgi:hypothetical protein